MITRHSIASIASMREAVSTIEKLEQSFLKTYKRKNTAVLTITSTSKPVYDNWGKMRLSKEDIEIRVTYDDNKETEIFEAAWFENSIKTPN